MGFRELLDTMYAANAAAQNVVHMEHFASHADALGMVGITKAPTTEEIEVAKAHLVAAEKKFIEVFTEVVTEIAENCAD